VTGPADVVRAALRDSGLGWEESAPGSFVVVLPGEHKLTTTCSLVVWARTPCP
jgi:hypothetical protein